MDLDEWEKVCPVVSLKQVMKYTVTEIIMQKLKNNLKRVISVDVPLLWKALVQVVRESKSIYGEKSGETIIEKDPAVFMMVVPAETVEDTINELLSFCVEGDIIIDHGNSNFKDSRRRAERLC